MCVLLCFEMEKYILKATLILYSILYYTTIYYYYYYYYYHYYKYYYTTTTSIVGSVDGTGTDTVTFKMWERMFLEGPNWYCNTVPCCTHGDVKWPIVSESERDDEDAFLTINEKDKWYIWYSQQAQQPDAIKSWYIVAQLPTSLPPSGRRVPY